MPSSRAVEMGAATQSAGRALVCVGVAGWVAAYLRFGRGFRREV